MLTTTRPKMCLKDAFENMIWAELHNLSKLARRIATEYPNSGNFVTRAAAVEASDAEATAAYYPRLCARAGRSVSDGLAIDVLIRLAHKRGR